MAEALCCDDELVNEKDPEKDKKDDNSMQQEDLDDDGYSWKDAFHCPGYACTYVEL